MKNPIRKYSLIIAILLVVIAVASVFDTGPSIQKKQKKSFLELKSNIENKIGKIVFENESQLLKAAKQFHEIIENTAYDSTDLLETALAFNPEKLLVNIFSRKGNLIAWNQKEIIGNNRVDQLLKVHKTKEAFFLNTPLYTYLSIVDEINGLNILLSVPIEKKFVLSKEQKILSLKHDLEKLFEVELTFQYTETNTSSAVIKIKNITGKTIGSVEITKQTNFSKKNKNTFLKLIKSLSLFFAFLFFLLGLNEFFKTQNSGVKTLFTVSAILLGRFLIFRLNITGLLGVSSLIDPIYFSSTFGFGIAKSPLELFLTLISALLIVLQLEKYLSENSTPSISNLKRSILSAINIILFVLLYNSFASTIKSVIFDSSILYFKDAQLFGSYQTTFMYLNILLSGVITSIFSVGIIKFLVLGLGKKNKFQFAATITLLSFLLIIDELLYSKSSLFMIAIFLFVITVLSIYRIYYKGNKYTGLVVLLIFSSIISISFLNFFNSELEKKSLKTIANEITRPNFELYEYYVERAGEIIKNCKDINISDSLEDDEFNELAFLIWNKTKLGNEVQNSMINIISTDKILLGSFSKNLFDNYKWSWGKTPIDSVIIKTFSDNPEHKTVKEILPIKKNNSRIGYVEITANYSGLEINLAEQKVGILGDEQIVNISVNPKKLKIFEFKNGKLTNFYTNVFLTNPEKETLQNSVLNNQNEAWLNIVIDNEKNLFYIKKTFIGKTPTTIAVGLRNQDLTWNLFDFFKVFFIHAIMILIFIIIYSVLDFKNWNKFSISFKTKILISLLIISIIPLILLAIYFKSVSDGKNRDAINYKLGKRADNVEEYINRYYNSTNLDEFEIFEKAVTDLGISYSLFADKELVFSSEGNYYKAGLFPQIINPVAFINITHEGLNEVILKEKIEGISFNALYHKIVFGNQTFIIKINDLFNSFQLPMSGIELNVILFGTYSLAIILIFILSTILANQISSPIEKLTKATRSVSQGDMDIQIKNFETGEIYELIDGFNKMVQKLKKNQIELAEAERESAWREMAKQVAHEIKNPLTPMKLAVQHLVIAHKDKSEKFDSIFEKVTNTIINQIDILKNIASEFSSFAKMPNLKLSEIDLVEVINETIDLFMEEKCNIKLNCNEQSIHLLSDREQTQRMFVNLIRNAIQANAKNIFISTYTTDNSITIEIKDDGNGIDNNIVKSIFEENFTTKKSGMGLGLSLSKKFLKMIGGEITIKETSENGTIFIIEIERKKNA